MNPVAIAPLAQQLAVLQGLGLAVHSWPAFEADVAARPTHELVMALAALDTDGPFGESHSRAAEIISRRLTLAMIGQQPLLGCLKFVVNSLVAGLPANDVILECDLDEANRSVLDAEIADEVVHGLNPDRQAVMNSTGRAAPVAAAGGDPIVGTDAVATCIAVLGRVRLTDGRWRVGCTHLSATDMVTREMAAESIEWLVNRMAAVDPVANAGPVELYLIGGLGDDVPTYMEYLRILTAALNLPENRFAPRPMLAGALLPGNQFDDHGLAVFVNSRGVFYTSRGPEDD